jgi:hypothetical protein
MLKFALGLVCFVFAPIAWADLSLSEAIQECSVSRVEEAVKNGADIHAVENSVFVNSILFSRKCENLGLPASTLVKYFHSKGVKVTEELDPLPMVMENPKLPLFWFGVLAEIGSDLDRPIYSPKHTPKGELSALHIAIQDASPERVRALLENGARVETLNWRGETPLYYAVTLYELVMDLSLKMSDRKRMMPVKNRLREVIQVLREFRADVHFVKDVFSILDLASEYRYLLK